MDFSHVESQYRQLKARLDAGQISEVDLRVQLQELMLEDEQGRWWIIGHETGQWYVHDGDKWAPAEPLRSVPPASAGVTSPQEPAPQTADAAAKAAARPATVSGESNQLVSPRRASGSTSRLVWVVLAGVVLVAIAVFAFVSSQGNGRGAVAVPDKVMPTPTAPVRSPAATATPTVARSASPTPFRPLATLRAAPAQVASPTPAKATGSTTLPAPQVLRVNFAAYPNTLDPQQGMDSSATAHLALIYEGLTRLDPNLNTVPGAAETWTYNDDATRLTFTLRPGLVYSDGSPLNALRFADAIRRSICSRVSDPSLFLSEIKGVAEMRTSCVVGDPLFDPFACRAGCYALAETVRAAHEDGAECEGYEDTACNTLTLDFSRPAPYFHTVMAERAAFPVKDESYVAGIEQLWSAPQLAVGNGPFVLQYLDPNSRALFKPNPRYWRGAPKVDLEVTYLPYGDALSAYMAGLLDIMALTTPQNVSMTPDEMLNNDLRSYPGACTYAVMFNQQRAPFDDPRVRQALAMALDRQALVDEVLARQGARSLLWIPPGYPGHNDAERLWEYDPEAASQFLAESSYGDSANLPPITATFSESPLDSAIWQWLQERWKGVVDVSIELEPVDPQVFPTLFDRVETAPQMFLGCWCALPDQHYWLGAFWRTGSPYAAGTGYSNPEFDVAVDEADRMPDPARRFELNATAQSLLMKDAPAVFAWSSLNNYLVKPWVKGLIPSPLDVAWPGSHDPLTVSIDTSLLPDH